MSKKVTAPPEVYQLHVWLREINPMIWRRLLVRSDSTIVDRHYTLQIAMGWESYHLYQFIIRGKHYGVAQPGGMGFPDDPTQVRLTDLHLRLRERFLYEYDFGDLYKQWVTLSDCNERSKSAIGCQRSRDAAPPINQTKLPIACIGGREPFA